jgi:hypothetical protein
LARQLLYGQHVIVLQAQARKLALDQILAGQIGGMDAAKERDSVLVMFSPRNS